MVGDEQGDQAQHGVPRDPARDNQGIAGRTGSGPCGHHRHVESDYSSQRQDRASCKEASHHFQLRSLESEGLEGKGGYLPAERRRRFSTALIHSCGSNREVAVGDQGGRFLQRRLGLLDQQGGSAGSCRGIGPWCTRGASMSPDGKRSLAALPGLARSRGAGFHPDAPCKDREAVRPPDRRA
jgi:hypothetical protein